MDIRPATPDDLVQIAAVVRAAYEPYVVGIGVRPAPLTADYAAAVHDGEAWLAVESGRTVGLIVLVPGPDHLLAETMAVLPDDQGRGVGSRLLTFAEEHALRTGLAEVRLYTNEAMTANLAYYPKRGYQETHRAVEHGWRRVYFRKVTRSSR